MKVYVLNKHSKPLMPCTPRKARILLRDKKAKVIKKYPFTIQLLYGSSGYRQQITLGIDTGSKTIGLSATTENHELYSAEVILRNDISDNITTKRQLRRTRRNRLRYRKPRFLNRVSNKKKGWLPPSTQHKIDTHKFMVEQVHKLLPVSKIIVETAAFDIQKINNPNISGSQYQQGNQHGFWNTREYVLYRDGHKCQLCKGKSKDKILNVHHIVFRSHGGTDKPNNLITLCNSCHSPKNHKKGGILWQWMEQGKKVIKTYKDATFMSIMRWAFYNWLKDNYVDVSMTYGYITKNVRISNNLPKEHYIDAYCIAGNINAVRLDGHWIYKKMRRHNRSLYMLNPLKGGRWKKRQANYYVKGFALLDKVRYNETLCFIMGRRATGYFKLRTITGGKVHDSASYKKIVYVGRSGGYMYDYVVH